MSYTINVTNHDTITIETGTTDNSTSLTLIGKNVPDYGQLIAQNFVNLMQNFAGTSEPNGPVDGQLYFDTNINALRLCQGGQFRKILSTVTTSAGVQPTSNYVGDLWWNSSNSTLNLYNGSSWTAIGPYVVPTSASAIPDSVIDSNGVSRDIIRFFVGTTTIMILSQYSFVPQSNQTVSNASLVGFSYINAGLTLNLSFDTVYSGNVNTPRVNATTVRSTTVNALNIGNTGALLTGTIQTAIQPNITNVGTLTALSVQNNASFQASITVTSVVSGSTISGSTLEGNTLNIGTVNGTTINGATGEFTGSVSVNSTNGVTAIVNGGTSGTGNIGASGATFNTVFAKATTAQYADLAEKYHSDQKYAPGTVMKIGGPNEITQCDEEDSYDVFGVISTAPAYLMNDTKSDEMWLPVALVGRCPVNVIGPVKKGQRLISAGNGCAKASDKGVSFRTVIGRALVDKTSEAAELIECYINTN